MTRFLLLAALAMLTAAASPAFAQTCTTSWASPVDGDFFDDSKWTNGAPGAESTACITVPGVYVVTLVYLDGQIGRIELGGTSGTQTLRVGRLERLGSGFVGENGRFEVLGTDVCNCLVVGLHHITDTLVVEGVLKGNDRGAILSNFGSGRIDIEPTGTLILDPTGGGVEIGDAQDADHTLIRLRGRLLHDSPTNTAAGTSSLTGDLVIEGGTIDVRDGALQYGANSDGPTEFRDATFNVSEGASFGFGGVNAPILLEGTVGGNVQGSLGIGAGRLQAGPDGATLDFRGNGLVLSRFTQALGFETLGGEILNTGVLQANGFVYFSQVVFRNEGTLRLVSIVDLYNEAVIRNEVGGTLDVVDEGGINNAATNGRVENFGLLLSRLENRGGATQNFQGTLRSQPGSEIRVRSGVFFTFEGPVSESFPADVLLTGDGQPAFFFSGFKLEGIVSPGTDATPVDTLYMSGHVDFSSPAGSQQLIIDVDAEGASDLIQHQLYGGRGAVTLGGTLAVRVRPGYTPQAGDEFTILRSFGNGISGQFQQVVVEGAPEGIAFVTELTPDRANVLLRAVVPVSVNAPVAQTPEGEPASFVLSHPATAAPFTIEFETAGTATRFEDYTLSVTRGLVRTQPNTTQTVVALYPRRDTDDIEGSESATLRVLASGASGPSGSGEATVIIQDRPSSNALAIDGVTPSRAQTAGTFTPTVFGTGFDSGASASLSGPATVTGEAVSVEASGNGLQAEFDLQGASPGTYDVVVESGGETATLAGAVTVAEHTPEPIPVWASISGTPSPRLGRFNTYTFTIGNDAPYDVYDALVTLYLTPGMEYEVEGVELISEDQKEIAVETEDLVYVPLYFYKLETGQTVDVTVRVRPNMVDEEVIVGYELYLPNPQALFTYSGETKDALADRERGHATNIDIFISIMDSLIKEGVLQNHTSSVSGNISRTVGTLPDCPPIAIISASHNDGRSDNLENAVGLALSVGGGVGIAVIGYTAGGIFAGPAIIAGGLGAIGGLIYYGGRALFSSNAPLHLGQDKMQFGPDESGDPSGGSGDCGGGTAAGSFDPNDKLGPSGTGAERYYRPNATAFPYTIRFENLDTATAPAQEVVVVDTLDTAVFDLSTFAFGPITWGESGRLVPPAGATSFEAEMDLSPEIPATLLVTASLDEASGRATWHFVTLDPATGDLPEDATVGFLPPNVTQPEGEGAVTFTVKAHEGLASGTAVSNQAEIVFDVNEPIVTPVWTNTVDTVPPASSVDPLGNTSQAPFEITVSASDAGSGPVRYALFAQHDGGPFEFVRASPDPVLTFSPEEPGVYGFYVRTMDAVGNVEGPKTEAEATTAVAVDAEGGPDLPATLTLDAPFPNPTRGPVVLRYGVPAPGPVRVRVVDQLGREIAVLVEEESSPGWHRSEWVPSVAAGIYTVEILSGTEIRHRRLTVVQ